MAFSLKQVSIKNSKYHLHRPCNPCVLCGKTLPYYTHCGAWADEAKEFIRHWKGEVQPDSCICPSHLKEAQRKHSPGFTPKLSEFVHPLQQSKVCVFQNCNASSKLIAPAFAPTKELLYYSVPKTLQPII